MFYSCALPQMINFYTRLNQLIINKSNYCEMVSVLQQMRWKVREDMKLCGTYEAFLRVHMGSKSMVNKVLWKN